MSINQYTINFIINQVYFIIIMRSALNMFCINTKEKLKPKST